MRRPLTAGLSRSLTAAVHNFSILFHGQGGHHFTKRGTLLPLLLTVIACCQYRHSALQYRTSSQQLQAINCMRRVRALPLPGRLLTSMLPIPNQAKQPYTDAVKGCHNLGHPLSPLHAEHVPTAPEWAGNQQHTHGHGVRIQKLKIPTYTCKRLNGKQRRGSQYCCSWPVTNSRTCGLMATHLRPLWFPLPLKHVIRHKWKQRRSLRDSTGSRRIRQRLVNVPLRSPIILPGGPIPRRSVGCH